ncbi:MAG: molybdopterin-binding/glycosyltransferase family 2 protein [Alphaproteobacteria bacterium]|nr:molybdopterin-binding/glycosyltransferase family 2 protein [Alphaproteobacteria bacterium]
MKFGPVDVSSALGAMLAHSLICGGRRLRKGHVLTQDDLAALSNAGTEKVIVARLDADDVDEDDAAALLAEELNSDGISAGGSATGRVNLFARHNGVLRVDVEAIDRFNAVDPSMTIATLPDYSQVTAGDMVATIKIIPFAVPEKALSAAAEAAHSAGILRVLPFTAARVGLVATRLPSLKSSVMDKTTRLLQARLDASGSHIVRECRVDHDDDAVASALRSLLVECDLIIIFGASAIVDPADVIAAAITKADGVVDHVGMPVDPGNLLVLGHMADVPVIGAPGCARSPKENGFDWVLARILAGETPSARSIMQMGVGGLLKEIASRPQPRIGSDGPSVTARTVDILVLAAGKASRMTAQQGSAEALVPHKLLAEFNGVPLIRKSVETALHSGGGAVHVVVGYRAAEMRGTLDGLDVDVIDNPDFDEGMASSLRAGVSAVKTAASGVLILLADMPLIDSGHLRKLLETFAETGGKCVVRAVSGDVRGNPVVLPRATFDAIATLQGDVGARQIIAESGLPVVDVDIGDAALLDVDTREAVLSAGGVLKR